MVDRDKGLESLIKIVIKVRINEGGSANGNVKER